MTGPQRFSFLNETRDLSDHGWDGPQVDRLWRYNLHYFDDLNAESANMREEWHRSLMKRWVQENPPGQGTGWEPYPTSIRIVNWIKWSLAGNELPSLCIDSLSVQSRWLSRRLETHLLGNHLLMNAKALVFAGLFFEGPEASTWLQTGLRILRQEIPEQILADGGQFELSPMYHALALEDMLDLMNVTTAFSTAIPSSWHQTAVGWWGRIESMQSWLAAMCHPDGEISFFNDASLGIAPTEEALAHYASRLGLSANRAVGESHPVAHLRESGYIRIQQDDVTAFLDVGPIGPTYLPAHAHADTLSFELSLYGQRVFVNSGTSCYGTGTERQRQRGTAAHNTVCIDATDSSEVWGGFRVGHRALPQGLLILPKEHEREIVVECSHDGYRQLPGKPIHQRRWLFQHNKVEVDDTISGDFTHGQARLHLHPDVTVHPADGNGERRRAVILRMPQGQTVRLSVDGGGLRQEHSTWHPQFGAQVANICLVIDFVDARIRTSIAWGEGK